MDRLTIGCEVCNNFFQTHETNRTRGSYGLVLSYAERALTRAKDLGATCVVFGSGSAKNVPKGTSAGKGISADCGSAESNSVSCREQRHYHMH